VVESWAHFKGTIHNLILQVGLKPCDLENEMCKGLCEQEENWDRPNILIRTYKEKISKWLLCGIGLCSN